MSAHYATLRGPKGEAIQVPVGLWIDGQLVSSSQGRTFETISAVSGKTLATLQEGNEADVDKAVTAAQKVSNDKLEYRSFCSNYKTPVTSKRLTTSAGLPKVARHPWLR